jgi:hypothetical protein
MRFDAMTHWKAFLFVIVDRIVGFAGPLRRAREQACRRTRRSFFEVISNPMSLGRAKVNPHPVAMK